MKQYGIQVPGPEPGVSLWVTTTEEGDVDSSGFPVVSVLLFDTIEEAEFYKEVFGDQAVVRQYVE